MKYTVQFTHLLFGEEWQETIKIECEANDDINWLLEEQNYDVVSIDLIEEECVFCEKSPCTCDKLTKENPCPFCESFPCSCSEVKGEHCKSCGGTGMIQHIECPYCESTGIKKGGSIVDEMIIKKYNELTAGTKKPLEVFTSYNADGNNYGVRVKNHDLNNVYMSDCKYSILVMGIATEERALDIIEMVKGAVQL